MSEVVGLGDSDADGRWIGVRRHQSILVIIGLLLVGDFVLRDASSVAEVVAGMISLVLAVPTFDGLTGAEVVAVTLRYLARTRWLAVVVRRSSREVVVVALGTVRTRGFELHHRGRLDLSGRDLGDAAALAHFADALAVGDDDRHFSVHVSTRGGASRSLVSLPHDVAPPPQWGLDLDLTSRVAGVSGTVPAWHLERWRYLRSASGVLSVMRIRDFSGASVRRGLLEHLQFACAEMDVAVHVDVVGSRRGARLSARMVHRQGSDDASSQAAGFRRSARSARVSERIRQREVVVAEGRALLRIGVFVVVRAQGVDELGTRVEQVRRRCSEAGLRCERGAGRQAPWFSLQLPGGPRW